MPVDDQRRDILGPQLVDLQTSFRIRRCVEGRIGARLLDERAIQADAERTPAVAAKLRAAAVIAAVSDRDRHLGREPDRGTAEEVERDNTRMIGADGPEV